MPLREKSRRKNPGCLLESDRARRRPYYRLDHAKLEGRGGKDARLLSRDCRRYRALDPRDIAGYR